MNLKTALTLIPIDMNVASKDDLKKIYKKGLPKYHPDKGGNQEKYSLYQEAYKVIYRHLRKTDDKDREKEVNVVNVFGANDVVKGLPTNFHKEFDNHFKPSRGYTKDELPEIKEVDEIEKIPGMNEKNMNEHFEKLALEQYQNLQLVTVTEPKSYQHYKGTSINENSVSEHYSHFGIDYKKAYGGYNFITKFSK